MAENIGKRFSRVLELKKEIDGILNLLALAFSVLLGLSLAVVYFIFPKVFLIFLILGAGWAFLYGMFSRRASQVINDVVSLMVRK